MTVLRFILAFGILLFAAYIVVMNWACVIVSIRNRKRGIDQHHSTVPLISLMLTTIAMVFYSRHEKVAWMLLVPALDIANWALLWAPVGLILELKKNRSVKPPAGGDGLGGS